MKLSDFSDQLAVFSYLCLVLNFSIYIFSIFQLIVFNLQVLVLVFCFQFSVFAITLSFFLIFIVVDLQYLDHIFSFFILSSQFKIYNFQFKVSSIQSFAFSFQFQFEFFLFMFNFLDICFYSFWLLNFTFQSSVFSKKYLVISI